MMKITGFLAALLLSCAAFGGQAKNLPEPSRLATFLAATKNAVVSQSVVGNLSAEVSQDWPPGGEKKTRASFVAIVAGDPSNPSVELGGMKVHIELITDTGRKKAEDTVYLDGDKLAGFERALEQLVKEQPRDPMTAWPGGGVIRCRMTGALNNPAPQVAGVAYTSPLDAGWCVEPAGYSTVLQSPANHRTYYLPGVPLERLVEIVGAAHAYIGAH